MATLRAQQPQQPQQPQPPQQPQQLLPPPSTPDRVDLDAPITSDVILEVRVGGMKPMRGLKVMSGIDKQICTGPVQVTTMGITGDEHDPTFHGGLDKALHGYCRAHYASWKSSFPEAAERFCPGGFGENLVFGRFNERNICIGDVYAVGSSTNGLLIQVSLPRQPCFKLNHRFGIRDFAPLTWKFSRTGWYYRVLRAGWVQAGDEVRLVRRLHADWPLFRVQEYLHRSPDNMAMVAELAAIDEFGDECKSAFRSRLGRYEARERRRKLREAGGEESEWRPYRVVEKRQETSRVAAFVLEADDGGLDVDADADAEPLQPGSHVRLRLGNGLVRTYSLASGGWRRFELGVALDAQSRGGSRYLHESVAVGSTVDVGHFAAGTPAASAASHHVFVAGGIGITAFLSSVERLHAIHCSVELHYAVRDVETDVPFRSRLDRLGPDVVFLYGGSDGLDISRIVRSLPWNAHISFCGPPRLMDDALRATRAAGLAPADVHFEAFAADVTGDPFDVEVVRPGHSENGCFHVDADETLLEVLRRHYGPDAVPSSCEAGSCATCKLTVRHGRIDHRGTALTDDEKAAGSVMLACVSRGIGQIVVEI